VAKKDIKIVKEDAILSEIKTSDLTTDCHFVHREGGKVDIVCSQTMVQIFDHYYDKGIKLTQIVVSGGKLNPKLSEPRI